MATSENPYDIQLHLLLLLLLVYCYCCSYSSAFFGIMMYEARLLFTFEHNGKMTKLCFLSINSIKKSWNAFQSSRWREMLLRESQQDVCEGIVNLKSEFAFSIWFRTRSNKCSRPTINLSPSHFVTITQDLHNIEKHSTDPNECICRLSFLFEGAFLFVFVG